MLTRIRRLLRRIRRRTVLSVISALLLACLTLGWFVGINPETGQLEFDFNPEYSLTGRTLNFAATNVGLPQIIGDATETPDALAFEETETESEGETNTLGSPNGARQATENEASQPSTNTGSNEDALDDEPNEETDTTTSTSTTQSEENSNSPFTPSTTNNNPGQGNTTSTTPSNNTTTTTRPASSLPYVLPAETGVLQPISSLQDISANFGDYYKVTTNGQILDGYNIDGCLLIEADNVTVKNSVIRCDSNEQAVIEIKSGFTGSQITQNTLDCTTRDCPQGIAGANFEASYNDISDVVIGIESRGNNVVAARNYVHDIQDGGFSLGLRGAGGSGLIFDGNYIQGSPALGHSIFIQPEEGNPPSSDALITNNYITGNNMWPPISCRQIEQESGCTVNGNYIDQTQNYHPIWLQTSGFNSASGNLYLDGTPIPCNRIFGNDCD